MIEFVIVVGVGLFVATHIRSVTSFITGCMGVLLLLVTFVVLIGIAMRVAPATKTADLRSDRTQRTLIVVPDPDSLAFGRSLDEWARANAPLTPLWK